MSAPARTTSTPAPAAPATPDGRDVARPDLSPAERRAREIADRAIAGGLVGFGTPRLVPVAATPAPPAVADSTGPTPGPYFEGYEQGLAEGESKGYARGLADAARLAPATTAVPASPSLLPPGTRTVSLALAGPPTPDGQPDSPTRPATAVFVPVKYLTGLPVALTARLLLGVETDRDVTATEVASLHHALAYAAAATIHQNHSLGRAHVVDARLFYVTVDLTTSDRTDPASALIDCARSLPTMVAEGSPVRSTDRAGAGTKGTRAVEPFAGAPLRVRATLAVVAQ